MSWEIAGLENIEGIRKVKWDALWHVMYRWGSRDTWDRVTKQTAMRVMKRVEKARRNNCE